MKLYTDVFATPSRIQGLLRLVGTCSPTVSAASMLMEAALERPGAEKKAINLIIAAKEANLVTEEANGDLAISFGMRPDQWSKPNIGKTLPGTIDSLLLTPTINGSENRLAVLGGWVMRQSPTEMPQGQAAIKTALAKSGIAYGEFGLGNDACVDMLFYWMKYLGLVWQYEGRQCEGLVPDPTAYLTRHLDKLLSVGGECTAQEFRDNLGALCPVLDGGKVHKEVGLRMEQHGIPEMPDDQLSPSLSFALRRMRRSKTIEFDCPDDQRTFLILANGEKIAFLRRPVGAIA